MAAAEVLVLAGVAPPLEPPGASLAAVLAHWRDLDLEARRPKLDELGLRVADLQEQSAANRKQLSDATREFKRSTAAAAAASAADSEASSEHHAAYAAAVAALLKRYQEEIDALTRRAKHGEGAFLDLYQLLSEAPDPAPALAAALDAEAQLAQVTAQLQRVSGELAEYKAESQSIKNQDLTLRRQEEAIRELAAALEAKGAELEGVRAAAAAEADAAVVLKMQAREAELADMLASTQASLEAMQRLYGTAQNQLFELQSTKEAAAVGRQAEMELAVTELDALQARLLSLEAEKSNLQGKLEANRQEAASSEAAAAAASSVSVEDTLRQELNSQREVSAQLRQDLAAARQQQHDSTAQWEDACGRLQEQLDAQGAELQRLHAELAARPTAARVADLQQQVRVLQAVGYGSLPEEDLGAAAEAAAAAAAAGVDPAAAAAARASSSSAAGGDLDHRGSLELGAGGVGSQGGLNLEGLLLAKNRKLEHEVTVARLAAAEARQQLEAAQEQVAELQEQLQSKTSLVAQLEEDLCSIRQGGGGGTSAAAIAAAALASGGLDRRSSSGAAAAGRRLSAAGSGSGELGRYGSGAAAAGASGDWGEAAAAEGGSDTMLRVLVGQRDRLRARVQELEVALAAAQAEGAAASQQLAAARADNVALIERLRFVGGYRQQMAAGGGGGGKGGGRDVEAGGAAAAGGEVVGRYSALYDEGINPFKEFQGQQREQKRKQMSVADKAMYSMGSLVYQSQAARMLTFGYLCVMHLLVFMSLTHATHRTSAHIMDHHDAILTTSRHDLTAAMHAGFPAAATGAAGRSS